MNSELSKQMAIEIAEAIANEMIKKGSVLNLKEHVEKSEIDKDGNVMVPISEFQLAIGVIAPSIVLSMINEMLGRDEKSCKEWLKEMNMMAETFLK